MSTKHIKCCRHPTRHEIVSDRSCSLVEGTLATLACCVYSWWPNHCRVFVQLDLAHITLPAITKGCPQALVQAKCYLCLPMMIMHATHHATCAASLATVQSSAHTTVCIWQQLTAVCRLAVLAVCYCDQQQLAVHNVVCCGVPIPPVRL